MPNDVPSNLKPDGNAALFQVFLAGVCPLAYAGTHADRRDPHGVGNVAIGGAGAGQNLFFEIFLLNSEA